jgi:chitin disaccharide deacetylase
MTAKRFIRSSIIICLMYSNIFINPVACQDSLSYATRLGWQKDDRVIIFHIDDAGMSYESNQGTIQALQFGIATSCSVMMPCPWVADITEYLRENPLVDAGIHLTHTSEWTKYRWRSLTGPNASPGLADNEGYLWNNVADVVAHAHQDEIEKEIKAQISSARKSGFNPTHIDTHMGTLWASPEYVNLYKTIGIEEHIPILLPAGHNTLLLQQVETGPLAGLRKLSSESDNTKTLQSLRSIGKRLWNEGLAVVDDLYILSYDWQLPSGTLPTDENIRKFKTEQYKKLLTNVKPGITVILIHCSDANETFNTISDSWITRRGDLLSMTDPELQVFIRDQRIVLTTWRELQQRREKLEQK